MTGTKTCKEMYSWSWMLYTTAVYAGQVTPIQSEIMLRHYLLWQWLTTVVTTVTLHLPTWHVVLYYNRPAPWRIFRVYTRASDSIATLFCHRLWFLAATCCLQAEWVHATDIACLDATPTCLGALERWKGRMSEVRLRHNAGFYHNFICDGRPTKYFYNSSVLAHLITTV